MPLFLPEIPFQIRKNRTKNRKKHSGILTEIRRKHCDNQRINKQQTYERWSNDNRRLIKNITDMVRVLELFCLSMYNRDMEKTLVFGGAFDPVHKEHVAMCKSAMLRLGISKLVLVPTVTPPHKSAGFLSFEQRCDLLKIAFDGVNFVIDDIENVRGKDNYSALTLPVLKEKYGDIVYLVGGDSLEYFDTWYHPEDIVKVCPIDVCQREGFEHIAIRAEYVKQKFGVEYILLEYAG